MYSFGLLSGWLLAARLCHTGKAKNASWFPNWSWKIFWCWRSFERKWNGVSVSLFSLLYFEENGTKYQGECVWAFHIGQLILLSQTSSLLWVPLLGSAFLRVQMDCNYSALKGWDEMLIEARDRKQRCSTRNFPEVKAHCNTQGWSTEGDRNISYYRQNAAKV